MTAIISTQKYKKIIRKALEEINVVIETYTNQNHQYLNNVLSLDIENLVVSKGVYEDKFLLNKLSEFKVKNSKIRVVVLVESVKKEDFFINELIKRGIYDICDFSEVSDPKRAQMLKTLISNKPNKFHDTLKWQKDRKRTQIHRKENLARKTIVFLNLTQKAGSTLIATSYAEYLAKKALTPALVEMPLNPEYFYKFGLELYESKKDKFFSKPHQIKRMKSYYKENVFFKRNILWLVSDPRKSLIESWNVNEMLQLLECGSQADIVIIDVGDYLEHESIHNLLPMVDKIFAIIEPRPVSIIRSIGKIKSFMKYQKYNSRVKVIFNKWDSSLERIGISNYINIKPDILVPNLEKASLYKSEYNCLSAESEIANLKRLKEPFQAMSKYIWPNYNYKTVIKTNSFVAEGS